MDKVAENYNMKSSNFYTLCLGDIIGYGPEPNEMLKISEQFHGWVIGNHDVACATGNADGFKREAKDAVMWTFDKLTTYNKTYVSMAVERQFMIIEENGIKLYLVHASPEDPIGGYIFPEHSKERKEKHLEDIGDCHLLVVGHTHIPMFYQSETGKAILNPGSVGQPRDNNPKAATAVLEISEDSSIEINWIRAKYDVREVAKKIIKVGLPSRLGDRLIFGE